MVIAGYAKHYNWFFPIYQFIVNRIKSKRVVVSLISALTGMLPIPGRVSVSAGILDTISSDEKKSREEIGFLFCGGISFAFSGSILFKRSQRASGPMSLLSKFNASLIS